MMQVEARQDLRSDYFLIHIVGNDGIYRRNTVDQDAIKQGVHEIVKHYHPEFKSVQDYDIVAITQSNYIR